MPKMKTHRGAAKRFSITGKGKVKRARAYTSHMFSNKTQKQKRKLRKGTTISAAEQKNIKNLIPYK